ncbi:P-type ATPase [Suillus occidentalis]|nr:P-type ATPase [Suillus occidentalis]
MYYAPSDTPALCHTSSLVEELGQIEFVFSDKTGTLTRNEMEFKTCSVAGIPYADVAEEGGEDEEGTRTFEELQGLLYGEAEKSVSTGAIEDREREVAREFMALLAEVRDGKTHYQASSPDEAALVAGAEMLGYQFHYEILNVCEFNSPRKRMSTIVRTPSGSIKLFCKGADTVILEQSRQGTTIHREDAHSPRVSLKSVTLTQLTQDYATEGLRTFCIAYHDIPEAEHRQWASIYEQAAATIDGRADALDSAAKLIEKDMFLLGATAIKNEL